MTPEQITFLRTIIGDQRTKVSQVELAITAARKFLTRLDDVLQTEYAATMDFNQTVALQQPAYLALLAAVETALDELNTDRL